MTESIEGRPSPAFRSVVVATDFQPPARAAVTWAARHLAGDGDLLLVRVVADDSVRGSADEALRERVAELALLGMPGVRSEVRVGDPADEIVRAAEEHAVDLIVLGEHAERTGFGQLLGGTGASVARRASVPVLIARNVVTDAPRTLLVALHDSPTMPQLLAWVERLATRFSASVTAIHVVPPSSSMPLMSSGVGVDPDRPLELLTDSAERWLETAVASLRSRVGTLTTSVVFGDPAAEILAAADRIHADIVVVGRGGVGRLVGRLLDGTTERVLRVGEAALLIVPATQSQSR